MTGPDCAVMCSVINSRARTQTNVHLTGPLFPIGIEHLICMNFSVAVRHMVIKGI